MHTCRWSLFTRYFRAQFIFEHIWTLKDRFALIILFPSPSAQAVFGRSVEQPFFCSITSPCGQISLERGLVRSNMTCQSSVSGRQRCRRPSGTSLTPTHSWQEDKLYFFCIWEEEVGGSCEFLQLDSNPDIV